MRLPDMKYADRITKSKQVKFYGLNHTLGAGEGELWDMRNLTGDHYPVLSPREKRVKLDTLENPGGIFSWGRLVWVDGDGFYYGGEWKGEVTPGLKTFASLGPNIVIFPDKCYYNRKTDTFGGMESHWEGEKLSFQDGLLYEEEAAANTVRAEGTDWSEYFQAGDAVTISGCTIQPGNNKTVIIRAIDGDKLYFYENVFTLAEEGAYEETGTMTVARTVPDLLFLCENENRLWGCTEDTIYASKQGDIFNWNVYDGLESDAWALTPGSAGEFTGCVSYKGYAVFFKEDQIYKVYGSTPSSYSVSGSATLGLKAGCERSLAVAGETLFYLGTKGVMAYAGGIPQPVSSALGPERFQKSVGGSDGLKYYASMQGEDGSWGLYVFDTETNFWYREDETEATHFALHDGELYLLNAEGGIWCTRAPAEMPEGAEHEGTVEWSAEFADFYEQDPNKKNVSKLQLRLELDRGAELAVLIQFDSDGIWRPVKRLVGSDPKRSWCLPVIPRRCDHYRIMLKGKGVCRLYSLSREYYVGSELKSRNGRN